MCVVLFLVLSKCLKSNESTTLHTAGAPTNTTNRNQPRKTRRTASRNSQLGLDGPVSEPLSTRLQTPDSTLQKNVT